jgi:hypothetical protein
MRERSICRKMPSFWLIMILFTAVFFSASTETNAQYFGQNRVRYKNLKFKVYETPHFDLYYYLKNEKIILVPYILHKHS